ncbi:MULTISPECIES: LacI family DNA-binding transcriptional regulator [Paenibacillus]|uniref:LacI family DNA-binding transcriptional regulator n=1 Tax=Paenibacillus campinasensis TaxID=66347 RepID=A0ABW9T694_9BACL|nr:MULTISPECIES: LacI family DNA-binding transcriptional regulator [Paenibacillus]MUG67156.1 LacI family DNA-binding transcriptional regulator [Paenibacillus campinasensis]PAK54960.1 transcriptional regulator [Paenibacillus sp. 7541]
MKNKVTLQEIAEFAGVSKFAVSRALSGKPGVSKETRDMILKAAGQLGYFKDQPLPAKERSQLQEADHRKWSGAVLVLFPNVRHQNRESLYWGPVFDGISARLNQKGLDIVTLTEPSNDHMFSLLNPQGLLGIVTVGSVTTQNLLDIKKLNIPVVMIDHMDPAFQSDTVFTDNLSAMRHMMTKLVSRGFTSFQYVGNIGDAPSFYERYLGYMSVLADHQLGMGQIPELISPDIGLHFQETLSKALTEHELPELFVCNNDITAMFVIDVLKSRGIDVPGQVQVTGFDNTYDDPAILATVNVDKELLGMRAVDQLLWRIVNPGSNYERLLIQADVLVREPHPAFREDE